MQTRILPEDTKVQSAKLWHNRKKISAALHDIYSHREGEHDDLLLALAVTVWASEHSAYSTDYR